MATRKAFLIRINDKLLKELESWAHEEFRSVNGQIEFLLRQQVMKRKGAGNLSRERSGENPSK